MNFLASDGPRTAVPPRFVWLQNEKSVAASPFCSGTTPLPFWRCVNEAGTAVFAWVGLRNSPTPRLRADL